MKFLNLDYCSEVLEELSSDSSEFAEELKKILESSVSMPNIPFPTLGGLTFWNNIAECNGWKIQQNMLTQHARILDKDDVRIAWGTLDEMTKLMEKMAEFLRAKKNNEKQNNLILMEEIKKLKELLDIGAITQEEYKNKKDELMSQIHCNHYSV